jgi:lipoprotein-releasing system permease protein
MRQPYELAIAARYLRTRSSVTFISFISSVSMIGIALAVALLIIVLSVMNGFEHELQRRILGMVSEATVAGVERPLEDWARMSERVTARDEIEAAAPYVEGQAMAQVGAQLAGVTVRGVDPALEVSVSTIATVMKSGSLEDLTAGSYRVIIGAQLAEFLDIGVGDELKLVLPEARRTIAGFVPRNRDFTVAGIFDAGMYEYDRGLVFTSFGDAALLFRTRGRATGLRLAVAERYDAREVAERVAQSWYDESGENLYYDNWTRQHYTFFRSIQLQKQMMFVILSLVIAVAAFNIVSTLMMVVRDKRGDIAILRSFGAARGSIMTVFASQGTFIGVVGTALGVLLALLICWQLGNFVNVLQGWLGLDLLSAEVYYLNDLPTQVRPLEVAQIGALALGLAVLATFYPSLAAARQPPAEALRYE